MFCQFFRMAALGCRLCARNNGGCNASCGGRNVGSSCGGTPVAPVCGSPVCGAGPSCGGLVTVSRTASVAAASPGATVEIALAVTNASTVPLRIFVRDVGTQGLVPDGTGVAVDGIASGDRSIAAGVDLGVVSAGQTVTVNYNVLALATGMQCGCAYAYFAPALGEWQPAAAETVRSNRLCIAVMPQVGVLPAA